MPHTGASPSMIPPASVGFALTTALAIKVPLLEQAINMGLTHSAGD